MLPGQFRDRILTSFEALKRGEAEDNIYLLPIFHGNEPVARLRPLGRGYRDEELDLMAEWRNQNRGAFLTFVTSTRESTRRWLEGQILARPDRILFLAELPSGVPFGQIGLTNFDFETGGCELDNWIRGQGVGIRGGMNLAIRRLMDWVFLDLGAASQLARVFSDNQLVLDLHHRNGLREEKRVALVRVVEESLTRWVEAPELAKGPERDLVYLRIGREGYRALNVPTQSALTG